MPRRDDERVSLTFSQITTGMRVFLKDLYGSEAYLNGQAAIVRSTQPSTGFCTVELEQEGTRFHFEPFNLYVASGGSGGGGSAAGSDWKAVTAADGREYFYNSLTGETSWERPSGTRV